MSLEPLEHSVLGTPQDQRDVSSSDDDLRVDSQSVVLDDRGVDIAPVVGCPEATQPPPEAGDAIVVGAVGSASPWFPAGWAHEVEFMIEPSDSLWASPVVLVTKKDGSTRFCVDYHRLNVLTTKDAYTLPRIDDALRLLGNQQWFSTMDLASGYWQVALSPEAKRKAAFVTNEGLFKRLMDRVLCGMRWSRCLVYLGDVISFGGEEEMYIYADGGRFFWVTFRPDRFGV